MKNYEWKLKSLAKGIDPELAVTELERIEKLYGKLTAETILNESRKPENILHPLFEWEDNIAAEQYRLQQARGIINNIHVSVIQNGEAKSIGAFEIVSTGEGRVYKNVSVMDAKDIQQVKIAVIRDLNILKNKLAFYDELQPMVKHLENAIQFAEK